MDNGLLGEPTSLCPRSLSPYRALSSVPSLSLGKLFRCEDSISLEQWTVFFEPESMEVPENDLRILSQFADEIRTRAKLPMKQWEFVLGYDKLARARPRVPVSHLGGIAASFGLGTSASRSAVRSFFGSRIEELSRGIKCVDALFFMTWLSLGRQLAPVEQSPRMVRVGNKWNEQDQRHRESHSRTNHAHCSM
jgi:hypothetical protein